MICHLSESIKILHKIHCTFFHFLFIVQKKIQQNITQQENNITSLDKPLITTLFIFLIKKIRLSVLTEHKKKNCQTRSPVLF